MQAVFAESPARAVIAGELMEMTAGAIVEMLLPPGQTPYTATGTLVAVAELVSVR